ncbi:hypothetical protein JCM10908_002560 [Rhodotorula pacifica]|uniref:uncharacterized protein n=1 Tax=Rhodotorula pacifica TaxID=1495444 RepID=UPI00317726CD
MVLTRLSSARPANTSLASSTLRPSHHHHATVLSPLPQAAAALSGAYTGLNDSDVPARPSSPLFGATTATVSPAYLASRDEPAMFTQQHNNGKPVDSAGESVWPSLLHLLDSYSPRLVKVTPPTEPDSDLPLDSIAFDAYFAQYGTLGANHHQSFASGQFTPVGEAELIKAAAQAEQPNSAPPLVPFGTASTTPSSAASEQQFPHAYYAQPQARALAFDQSLASPLFDADEFYSPYLNDTLPASALSGPNASHMAWDVHAGTANEWSPVLSDVSPALTISGDFGVDSSASSSPSVQDHLALFGDLSVTGSTTTGAPSNHSDVVPVYSPVISPTEMTDIDVSPSAMLPPPLPLISSVLPGGAVAKGRPWSTDPTHEAVSYAPEAAAASSLATPPAERDDAADDDFADPDFVPSAPARPTRSAARRRSSSTRPDRLSSSPAPHRSAPTGTAPLRITDLTAPVQDRKYQVESRTSAKPIPKNLAARRAKKLARGESVSSEREAVDEASKRRMANTLAARESRKRKAEYLTGLEEQVALQAQEIELLRAENDELRREYERVSSENYHRTQHRPVKAETDEHLQDDDVLHATRSSKKRRAGVA